MNEIISGKYKLYANDAETGQVWLKRCDTGEGVLLKPSDIHALFLKHYEESPHEH